MPGYDKEALGRTLDAIDGDLRTAIALSTVYLPASYDASVIGKFDNTYAAHVLTLARDQLTLAGIGSLARIWDQAADAQSVPAVLAHLRTPDVTAAIVSDRRTAMLSIMDAEPMASQVKGDDAAKAAIDKMAKRDADAAEDEFQKALTALGKRIDTFIGSGAIQSLRVFRDKVIAHRLEETRAEKTAKAAGVTIEPLKRSDLQDILEETVGIVTELNAVARSHHPSFDKFAGVWRAYAGDFWGRVSSEPKARPLKDPTQGP